MVQFEMVTFTSYTLKSVVGVTFKVLSTDIFDCDEWISRVTERQ